MAVLPAPDSHALLAWLKSLPNGAPDIRQLPSGSVTGAKLKLDLRLPAQGAGSICTPYSRPASSSHIHTYWAKERPA